MTSRDFAYWLMGSLELTPPEDGLNKEQTQILKNHLNMVFAHDISPDGEIKDRPVFSLDGQEEIDGLPKVNC
jgi:hypothetical protein